MSGYLAQAASYLVQVVVELFILAVLLRFLLQLSRASFRSPPAQFLVALSNPLLRPLRRVLPGWWRVDTASVVLLLALKVAELAALGWIRGVTADPLGLLIVALAGLLRLAVYVYIVVIVVRVVLSWIDPYGTAYSPVAELLVSLSDPLLRPARRLIPTLGGFDLSPIAVFIVLQLILILLIQPLHDLGMMRLLPGP